MLKKLLSSLLLNCLLLSSAQAASADGLKAAFDSLSYSLTVEWDQQDQNFANDQIQKFNSEVNSLKLAGLSQSEMAQFLKLMMKGKADAQVDALLQAAQNNSLTQAEIASELNQMISLAYNDGAHYLPTGGKIALGVLGVVGVVLIASVIIVQNSDSDWMGDWE